MDNFPDDDCLLLPSELPPRVYRTLTLLLDENDSWKKIAEHIRPLLPDEDMQNIYRNRNHGERLLNELGCRFCTVGAFCVILKECGLCNILLLFREPEPVQITEEPCGGLTRNRAMVERGQVLHLTCKAEGLPPPSYQWYCGEEKLQGCTNPDLYVRNFSIANEGNYYCTVHQEGLEDSLASDVVTVNMAPERPVVEDETQHDYVCRMGSTIVISVRARGHPRPTYQWFRGTRQLEGHTEPILKIENITENEEGEYRCFIRNAAGDVWSEPCRVIVFMSPDDLKETPRPMASAKVALLIANQTYKNMSDLTTPVEDVRTLAEILRNHDFLVLALLNLSLVEMRNVIKEFCKIVPKHAYVVFYYAGHGFEMKDKYMLPVSSPDPDSYLKKDALSEGELLRDILDTKPEVLLELLDMCLKSPGNDNKAIFQEVADLHEYKANNNLIQGYSTTSYLGAYERHTEGNGLFVKFLKEYLVMDVPIVTILAKVAKDMEKEHVKQMPYRGTNVTKEHKLTDPTAPCSEVQKQIEMLNNVPNIRLVRSEKSGHESMVTCAPYLGVYCNALQVYFTNLQLYNVTCHIQPELPLLMHRLGQELLVTVWNIQKMRTSQDLCLRLESRDGSSDELKVELGKPLIAVADLWSADA